MQGFAAHYSRVQVLQLHGAPGTAHPFLPQARWVICASQHSSEVMVWQLRQEATYMIMQSAAAVQQVGRWFAV